MVINFGMEGVVYVLTFWSNLEKSPFIITTFSCSTLGQGLKTSTYPGESIFSIALAIFGLILFALLIGNMQVISNFLCSLLLDFSSPNPYSLLCTCSTLYVCISDGNRRSELECCILLL